MSVRDWYFAGLFDESFWAQAGKKERIIGKEAAEVLRQLVAEAGEADLTWLPSVGQLDALCRQGDSFEIKRKGGLLQWALNPFASTPEATGFVDTIGGAIAALVSSTHPNYSTKTPATQG